MTIEIDISAFEEAVDKADDVDRALRSKSFEQVLRKSVAPTVRAAKRFAPVESGTLKRALRAKIIQYEDAWVAIVEPRRPPAFHRHLVEFGHGGPSPAPAHPYMQPAILATRSQVQQEFEQGTAKVAEKAWT